MKKTGLILFVIVAMAMCLNAQSKETNGKNTAKIVFTETEHNYGTIKQGSDGTCEFVFKNEGNKPLILSNVRSTCGCTVPDWPKKPINKNKKANIEVKYNTRIVGSFSKSIFVYSNGSEKPVVLKIKGTVVN